MSGSQRVSPPFLTPPQTHIHFSAHGELVTPTGISLVKSLAISYGQPPPFVPELVGCGAGTKDFTLHPNIVRVVIGRRLDSFSSIFHPSHSHRSTLSMEKNDENSDTVSVLQANLDDMNPQVLGYVQERLLSKGALDVWTQHIQVSNFRYFEARKVTQSR